MALNESGSSPSPPMHFAHTFILKSVATGIVRNTFLMFINHLVSGILFQQLEWTKIVFKKFSHVKYEIVILQD